MPDPKLKAAMEEIKPILKKYDCGAQITLVSESHSEFLYFLDTSWSACKTLDVGVGALAIAVEVTPKTHPDKNARRKLIKDTVSLILGIEAQAQRVSHEMQQLAKAIGQKVGEISHTEIRDN